ncbi:MAG: CapA family protein [Frankia sp.]|nr:CapA family protein [Frankia sp.]
MNTNSVVRLCLCGDVMLGRGVDQALPHPGDPRLREEYVDDARDYLRLAEVAHGQLRTPVDPRWPWGEALAELDEAGGVRVINLETAITRSDDFAPGKAVHYRMNPDNLACLTAARPDVCSLANNHVLDFGHSGLAETLEALAAAGIATAGAGRDAAEAWRPAAVPARPTAEGDARDDGGGRAGGRVLVLAVADQTSGVPPEWAATEWRPGVALLPPPWEQDPDAVADLVLDRVWRARRPADRVVVSIHWGSNWGYGVDDSQVQLAHRLIDGGVDVVHGHSSHHPRPAELYGEGLILYGCGDFIDDYEGIGGYEYYRDDLRPLYLVTLDQASGEVLGAELRALRARRLRLERAGPDDTSWLADTLDRVSRPYGTRCVAVGPDRAAFRRT